jgi:nitrogen-specific signal transduction histidine kinase
VKLDKTREALNQSQKMQAIGHLTGGIAHDFNNLLMVVLSSLELLRRRIPPEPKITALLDNAVQGVPRGTVLTKRMLAFARRQELNTETIHVPELVRGMSDMLQRSLGQTISVETRFPLSLSPISADANQLEMALLNLAVNSRDAMPQGGRLIISANEEALIAGNTNNMKPGRYVRLSLTDTGEGMDEETLRRAGEPFFTTKGVGKGTGLGLPMVHGLAEQFGGRCTGLGLPMVHGLAEQFGGRFALRSRVGEGTIAEIWLPAAERVAMPEPTPSPAPTTESYFEPLVVLAVDDDPLVLTNTLAMLEVLGHTAIEASSGRRALEILRDDNSIDLVVIDQVMPDMTGAELAKAIRSEWPKLSIILATGFAETPSDSIALPRLSKPFTQADLAEKISLVHGQADKKGRLLRLRNAENPKA